MDHKRIVRSVLWLALLPFFTLNCPLLRGRTRRQDHRSLRLLYVSQ
jgi:hypothetical protein